MSIDLGTGTYVDVVVDAGTHIGFSIDVGIALPLERCECFSVCCLLAAICRSLTFLGSIGFMLLCLCSAACDCLYAACWLNCMGRLSSQA